MLMQPCTLLALKTQSIIMDHFLCIAHHNPRKEKMAEQREYKKKKAQKKVQRMKELEQEREDQKSKWQQFNNKAYSKNKKGQVRILLYLDVS